MMQKKGFTLIEMLIVIVIIGILSASLLPRVMGLQARARDTAREADTHNLSIAIELYALDNGEYPDLLEFELAEEMAYNKPTLLAFAGDPALDQTILLGLRIGDDEECTGRICNIDENIGTVGSIEFQKAMEGYINKIPMDKGNGLSTQSATRDLDQAGDMEGDTGYPGGGLEQNPGGMEDRGEGLSIAGCSEQGDYFAYTAQRGMFAITSLKESKKGNTDNCYGNNPDPESRSMGLYQTLIHINGMESMAQPVLDILE